MKLEHLKFEFKITDSGDKWGNTLIWLFNVADEIYFNRNFPVPIEWGFKPSPCGPQNDPEEYQAEIVREVSDKDLLRFGNILNRYSNILRKKGLDY